jgi:hypothetical protein
MHRMQARETGKRVSDQSQSSRQMGCLKTRCAICEQAKRAALLRTANLPEGGDVPDAGALFERPLFSFVEGRLEMRCRREGPASAT